MGQASSLEPLGQAETVERLREFGGWGKVGGFQGLGGTAHRILEFFCCMHSWRLGNVVDLFLTPHAD